MYTGLAIGSNASGPLLYAANGPGNRIDVFNGAFASVGLGPGAFATPAAAAGLTPFNVQNIGSGIFVTYAPIGGRANQIHVLEGTGAVAEFDMNGNLIRTIVGSKLASPWGIARAPAAFGPFSGDLLVGNFSVDASEINAFDFATGALAGTIPINTAGQNPGGLWALAFGNAGNNGDPNTLFFSDGINGEADGLFARITFVPELGSMALLALGLLGLGFIRRKS